MILICSKNFKEKIYYCILNSTLTLQKNSYVNILLNRILIIKKVEASLKELTVKAIFFSSPEDNNVEVFIDDFTKICSKYQLSFSLICKLFENINSIYLNESKLNEHTDT